MHEIFCDLCKKLLEKDKGINEKFGYIHDPYVGASSGSTVTFNLSPGSPGSPPGYFLPEINELELNDSKAFLCRECCREILEWIKFKRDNPQLTIEDLLEIIKIGKEEK